MSWPLQPSSLSSATISSGHDTYKQYSCLDINCKEHERDELWAFPRGLGCKKLLADELER